MILDVKNTSRYFLFVFIVEDLSWEKHLESSSSIYDYFKLDTVVGWVVLSELLKKKWKLMWNFWSLSKMIFKVEIVNFLEVFKLWLKKLLESL